jgi:arabinofuranosyltransferase
MSDDGFINLRVVSQIQAGHGPVFNAGERVEAATSPLWVFLLTLGDVVTPLRLEWIAVLTGIGLTLAGMALAISGSIQLQRRESPNAVWIPAGALVLAVFAPMWRFASSGLETGVTFAWLGASLLLLARWSTSERSLSPWAAMLLGLGSLVRPELILVSIGFVAVVLVGEWAARGWRGRAAVVGAAFALPTAYQIFRMGYYGSLVPNTAFAKEATRSYWSAGLTYLRRTVIDHYALWVPLLVLIVGGLVPLLVVLHRARRRRSELVVTVFGIGAFAEATCVVYVGGDFMHNRFLLPALFLLVAPVAVVSATRQFVGALLVIPWAIVALVALRGPEDKLPTAFVVGTPNPITLADFGMAPGGPQRRFFEGDGVHYLQRRLRGIPNAHDPALATYGVGVPAYALGTGTYVLDLFGLADPFTSHLELEQRSLVAHEKPLPRPWIPARLLVPGSPVTLDDLPLPSLFFTRSLEAAGGQSFDRRVRDARHVLDCPRLAEFFATYRAPLDLGRFLDNLGDAFSSYGFRIPPEPRRALAELC